MSDCLFCSIIKGDIPCAKVYEDENIFAFLDISPFTPGHTLVLPKRHYANILELDTKDAEPLMAALQKVGKAVMSATGAEGFHVLQNNFPAAGQTVFHLHWHIIPRKPGDGITFWPQEKYDSPEVMQELAKKISGQLA